MKHLLNNLSEEEKNSIREQHEGGMKVINENFHKMVSKKLGHVDLYINEQQTTKVLGPFKDSTLQGSDAFSTNTVYVVKLDSDSCRYFKHAPTTLSESEPDGDKNDVHALVKPTNGKCPERATLLPGNKYYVAQSFGNQLGLPLIKTSKYMLATNGEKGYDTPKEAKEAVSDLMNPQGNKGRQVSNYTDDEGNKIKTVDKYNRKGDLKKRTDKLTTASGEVSKMKTGTGL